MAFTGFLSGMYILPEAGSEGVSPSDLVIEIGTGTLTAGTVEVPTKLTSVDFAFLQYDGTVAADATWIVLNTDKAITTSAVTVNGFATGTPTFNYMFVGRVAKQI